MNQVKCCKTTVKLYLSTLVQTFSECLIHVYYRVELSLSCQNSCIFRSLIVRDMLQWLPVEYRITFKIILMGVTLMICVALKYIRELCVPVSSQPGCRSLCCAARGDLM